ETPTSGTLCQREFLRSFCLDETRLHPKNDINYSYTFKALEAVKDVVGVKMWECESMLRSLQWGYLLSS
ncbi:unnamed protein product, partial [Brassica rapa subsp. trilocularis]